MADDHAATAHAHWHYGRELVVAWYGADAGSIGALTVTCFPPPISGQLHILFEHVAPRQHEWNQHHAYQTSEQRFSGGRTHLLAKPEGQPHRRVL